MSKSAYNVKYVDHASTEELRSKYAIGHSANVELSKIRDVDIIWNKRLAAIAGAGYAYCLASHVIEHVANPVGWLIEIAEVLKPGGRLNLAVPEKTRTFDHLRTPSTAAAMLEAYKRNLTRPSFAQIFDHIANVIPLGTQQLDQSGAAKEAFKAANRIEASGEYADAHCHVWTWESFKECWSVIDAIGIVPLTLVTLTPPFSNWNEFIVSFVRKT